MPSSPRRHRLHPRLRWRRLRPREPGPHLDRAFRRARAGFKGGEAMGPLQALATIDLLSHPSPSEVPFYRVRIYCRVFTPPGCRGRRIFGWARTCARIWRARATRGRGCRGPKGPGPKGSPPGTVPPSSPPPKAAQGQGKAGPRQSRAKGQAGRVDDTHIWGIMGVNMVWRKSSRRVRKTLVIKPSR